MKQRMQCGYCLGEVIPDPATLRMVHKDTAQRVTRNGPGDKVSTRHNRAGSVVLAVDLVEWKD